ncbi:hypothetical protein [Streptomyces sp. NRRL S-87]|uniref:hypothetical protein n=1 Tax=Streptomyces sp. NRRL S-87 TaxID=1463920 RepID=UPI00131E85E7|nr:hypothetical protein [Streptomyces sp. NRRL S-87]
MGTPLGEPPCDEEALFIPSASRPDVVSEVGVRAWLVAEALRAFEEGDDAAGAGGQH